MGEGLKNRIQADQRWLGPGARRLLAILANPPQATSGDRTYRRVAMASALLGCDEAAIVNLLGIPSRDVTAIGVLAVTAPRGLQRAPQFCSSSATPTRCYMPRTIEALQRLRAGSSTGY